MRTAEMGIERGFERLSDRYGPTGLPLHRVFVGGGFSFTAPQAGDYLISAWGPGSAGQGSGNDNYPSFGAGFYGGNSGAFCRKKVTLQAGDSVSGSVGLGGRNGGGGFGTGLRTPTATTVSGPGFSMTANAGAAPSSAPVAATATGGDTNISGNVTTNTTGASGPSGSDAYGPINSGNGGPGKIRQEGAALDRASEGDAPSAGGGCCSTPQSNSNGIGGSGASGLVVISYLGPSS